MKQVKNLILGLCLAVLSSSTHADIPEKTMEVAIDWSGLLTGKIPFTFRIKVNDKVALGFHPYVRFFSLSKKYSWSGIGAHLSGRFYLTAPAFNDGWYVQPGLGFSYTKFAASTKKFDFFSLYPNLLAGYSWVWDSGFSISLGLGAIFVYNFTNQIEDYDVFGVGGILPTSEISLGWAW